MLPDLVNAKRYIDACLVRHCAVVLADVRDGLPGPFLLAMFEHGVKEWEAERERERWAMLETVGLTAPQVENLGLERASELFQELADDPEKAAALQKFADDHPEIRAMAEAEARSAEEAAFKLLKRDDARDALLLTADEVIPWFPLVEQRLVESGLKVTTSKPNRATLRKLSELFYAVSEEMAGKIWTAGRLQEFRARVLEYRRVLDPQDREGVEGVIGVLTALSSGVPPQENHFLTILCWESIRSVAAGGHYPVPRDHTSPGSPPPPSAWAP